MLKNVEDEDVLIETAIGERSISKQREDTIFGKTRILKEDRDLHLYLNSYPNTCTNCSMQMMTRLF
jgi:hypothetical protein